MLRRIGLGLTIIAMAQVGTSAARQAPEARPAVRMAVAPRPAPPAPKYLRDRVNELGRSFDGQVGIAVRSVDDGWSTGWKADDLYPQQSVSKLWVSITALDAVDKGRVRLDDRVTLERDDITLFHQPIAALIRRSGSYTTTLDDLMFKAITTSDNTANDKLMRSVGGPEAVRAMIKAKHLGSIRFYNGERALQSKIAGLIWSPSYSLGNAFYEARNALPMSVRKAAFDRYIADPYDGASPHAIATALAALKRGELLSPDSTRRLLSIMGQTRTGKLRVRAALAPGWDWNHKTGTGQELSGRIGGINDIGLLTAPDGSVYAMAIMTIPDNSDGGAQELMRNVAKAVIDAHEARGRAD
jgi:beta-lactamase class A